ncbi:PepSY domain-containing protein [Hydrocarboniphaga sp.]|uniref:PepSY domain-containing protein n=1 Tax=Hydrocarboniphaga sp. TaxID=2033016 RepID=UPI003D0E837E
MKWKRPLFIAHRWAGIVLCAFFVLWFVSGIFMMYVEFPQLTRGERLAALPALDFSTARLSPAQALATLRAGDFGTVGTPSRNLANEVANPAAAVGEVGGIRLAMLLGRPQYIVQPRGSAQPRAVFADDGRLLPTVDADTALKIAGDFARRAFAGRAVSPQLVETVQTDQWSVSSGLNAHRPLHRIALDDADGTELYVSSSTGEVVRDSRRQERLLNYAAAVTHWLYPTVIRRYPEAWAWMVDILSGAGAALAVSGIWIGLLRWKRRPKPGKSSIPYRGLMRWHHITGLAFGLFALTWVFSGLLSMNPGKINPPRSPTAAQRLVYSGKALTPGDFAVPSFVGVDAIEAELMHYDSRPYYLVTLRDGRTQLRPADGGAGPPAATAEAMLMRAAQLMPHAHLSSARVMERYDDYYFARHPENASKPLPVIRVEFDDAEHTWFHLNPASGQIIERSTRVNRVYRWLYNGLHSFDLLWLWERRPLWDIVVITFSLGGIALSLIGFVAGVKRLRIDLGLAPRSRYRHSFDPRRG